MGVRDSLKPKQKTRRDGWTSERQLRFLAELERTGSVTKAARAVGLSRESAYRLRAREGNELFAAAWDKALRPAFGKGHALAIGRPLNRLRHSPTSLGNQAKVTKWRKWTNPRIDPFANWPL